MLKETLKYTNNPISCLTCCWEICPRSIFVFLHMQQHFRVKITGKTDFLDCFILQTFWITVNFFFSSKLQLASLTSIAEKQTFKKYLHFYLFFYYNLYFGIQHKDKAQFTVQGFFFKCSLLEVCSACLNFY